MKNEKFKEMYRKIKKSGVLLASSPDKRGEVWEMYKCIIITIDHKEREFAFMLQSEDPDGYENFRNELVGEAS